jgi:hypothetical protein
MSDENEVNEGEPKYTLDEARAEIARQECEMAGHLFDVLTSFGHGNPTEVVCARCGRSWHVEEKG